MIDLNSPEYRPRPVADRLRVMLGMKGLGPVQRSTLEAAALLLERNQLVPLSNPDRFPVRWCGNAHDHGEHVVADGSEPFFCPGDGMGG